MMAGGLGGWPRRVGGAHWPSGLGGCAPEWSPGPPGAPPPAAAAPPACAPFKLAVQADVYTAVRTYRLGTQLYGFG